MDYYLTLVHIEQFLSKYYINVYTFVVVIKRSAERTVNSGVSCWKVVEGSHGHQIQEIT